MQKQTPRKTYAFVGDGETEQWYLQMLKKNETNLTVKGPKDKTPAAILKSKYKMLQTDPNLKRKVVFIGGH